MFVTTGLALIGLALPIASALPASVQQPLLAQPQQPPPSGQQPPPSGHHDIRPLVLWHGLGDTADSSGMHQIKLDLEEKYPGLAVWSVKVPSSGSTVEEERKAGWYGNATAYVDDMAEQVASIPELKDGFDAVGLSQGGIFLRDYVQRYNDPPVNNLITFGSPHMGISALIPCKSSFDFWCMLAKSTAQRGVYTRWAQENLIQAAYFRDPERLEEFHRMNVYLTSLNGELAPLPHRHRRLAALSKLVMVQFDQDTTVYPKESAQFGYLVDVDVDSPETDTDTDTDTSINRNSTLVTMQESPFLWENDSIGLRTLNIHDDGLVFEHCPGAHMDLEWGGKAGGEGCAERILGDWIAGKP